ncbi:MAG: hypothetical protein HS132_09030 [Planctomycetia bacterium]|nr:hypothetical protein [Planctomycetia bacterium]
MSILSGQTGTGKSTLLKLFLSNISSKETSLSEKARQLQRIKKA